MHGYDGDEAPDPMKYQADRHGAARAETERSATTWCAPTRANRDQSTIARENCHNTWFGLFSLAEENSKKGLGTRERCLSLISKRALGMERERFPSRADESGRPHHHKFVLVRETTARSPYSYLLWKPLDCTWTDNRSFTKNNHITDEQSVRHGNIPQE